MAEPLEMIRVKSGWHMSYWLFLKSSPRDLIKYVKNKEFMESFEKNLDHLSTYKDKILEQLDAVKKIIDDAEEVRCRVDSLFGTMLPADMIRELASYLRVDDLPLEKLTGKFLCDF